MKKEIIIGLVGVIALAVLFLGIKFLKGVSLFTTSEVYYVSFSNAKELAKSSSVYADGFKIGRVSNITYDFEHPGEVIVEMTTNSDLRMGKGTQARLETAMLGGCTLHLDLAKDYDACYEPGDTIRGIEEKNILKRAGDIIPDVQRLVDKVDTLVTTMNALLSNPNLPLVMEHAEQITDNLNRSSQQLESLLKHDIPQLTASITQTSDRFSLLAAKLNQIDMQATMDSVNRTIGSVHAMMVQMQNPDGTFGKLITDPSIYDNLNHTIQSADSLVTDLKAHPKRYVHFSVFGRKN